MKYAFIIGSNAFIVPHGVITFTDGEHSKEILRIKSLYYASEPASHLSVDLDIEGPDGSAIKLINNTPQIHSDLDIVDEYNSISILGPNGRTIIHVQQMDEDSAMALEHNIVAELEISSPFVAIRIFGDFKAGGLNISAESEKLFINDTGYATSAMHGKNQLQFTADGVVL